MNSVCVPHSKVSARTNLSAIFRIAKHIYCVTLFGDVLWLNVGRRFFAILTSDSRGKVAWPLRENGLPAGDSWVTCTLTSREWLFAQGPVDNFDSRIVYRRQVNDRWTSPLLQELTRIGAWRHNCTDAQTDKMTDWVPPLVPALDGPPIANNVIMLTTQCWASWCSVWKRRHSDEHWFPLGVYRFSSMNS